jgi:hypothetical protein
MNKDTAPCEHVVLTHIAKLSALTWLHECQEHENLMHKSAAEWPGKTYQLAVHIQCAISEAQQHAFRAGLMHAVQAAEEKRLYWLQTMAGGSTATMALSQLRQRLKAEAESNAEFAL